MATFFANYGFYPTMSIDLQKIIDKAVTTQRLKLHIEDADKFANKMNKLYFFL